VPLVESSEQASRSVNEPPPPAVTRALSLFARRCTSVFAYHGVADLPLSADPSRLMIPPNVLRSQAKALQDAGFEPVTVSELGRRTVSETPPPGLVALTFDDAFLNILDPLLSLAEQDVPTTVYVTTDWIGGRFPRMPDAEHSRILDRGQVRALAQAGVEIGAHTVSHPDLSILPFAESVRELRESREILESITGGPVTTAAYPFGRYSEDSLRAASEAGFDVAVAVEEGRGWDPLAMSRVNVGRGESWPAFTVKATGQWPRFSASATGRFARSAVNRLRGRAG
jgi:peptidoglycan/xylan/chitin deacetylase (PgdA/CDA1 family)